MLKTDTLIIGGGLAGLAAARGLEGKEKYILCERKSRLGGLAASIQKNGFTFDYSGHLLHLRWPETKKLILGLLGNNYSLIRRRARIYSHGVYTHYPFQVNLSGLPDKVKSECVLGFLKARLRASETEPGNFRDWSASVFGAGISKHFMLPYNAKLWRYPLERLSTEWCAPFVPRPTPRQVIEGAYLEKKEALGYNACFYYPKEGGIQSLPDAFAGRLKNVELNCGVDSIDLNNRIALCGRLGPVKYGNLINTSPLRDFVASVKNPPAAIKNAGLKLRHNTVYVLNLGAKNVTADLHWAYFPEKKFPFYRAGIATNFSKKLAPGGRAVFYIEIASCGAPLDLAAAETEVIRGLKACGLIKSISQVVERLWLKIPCAYVIYDRERAKAMPLIFDWLKRRRVQSIGRYGAWKYSFMEESVKEGLEAAEKILTARL